MVQYGIQEQNWAKVESLFKNQKELVKLIFNEIRYKENVKSLNNGGLPSYIKLKLENKTYDLYEHVFGSLFKEHPDDYMEHYMNYIERIKPYLFGDGWYTVFEMWELVYYLCEGNYLFDESNREFLNSRTRIKLIKRDKEVLNKVLYFKMKLYCIWTY